VKGNILSFLNGLQVPNQPTQVEPVNVTFRGESMSSTVRKKARVANFGLPAPLDQSDSAINALSALEGIFLPDFEDADYVYVERVIAQLDEFLASALTSPEQVTVPAALARNQWFQESLQEGAEPLDLLQMAIVASRIYLWMRRFSSGIEELMVSHLDLEDGFRELRDYILRRASRSPGAQPKVEPESPLKGFPVQVEGM